MPFTKGNKYGGRRSKGSAPAAKPNKLRLLPRDPDEDEEMGDADELVNDTPQDETIVDDDAATPAQDDDEEDEEEDDDDDDAPPTITTLPRRRSARGGASRGSARKSLRGERVDYGTPQPFDGDEASESGTPFRRRTRGRGEAGTTRGTRSRGGFRGRRRTVQPEGPRLVVDKDGQTLEVVDDEVQVDDDEEGNTKVDAKGNLQGGREYRVRTFKILGKEDRLYMLSTEPARCCGFRDSYLFFNKHPKLYKVLVGEEEKKDLIDRDILPNSYKGRNIGVVTARSVFREFGARIIVGGRKVIDAYKVTEARERGEVEGELADPEDRLPEQQKDYNRNRYVAWHGASDVYKTAAGHVGGGEGKGPAGKPGVMGKRKTNVTVQNWQVMHAREASRFNSALTAMRASTLNGVYDTHTNLIFYPTIMQPTHAKWEQIAPAPPTTSPHKPDTNGHLLTNGSTPTSPDPKHPAQHTIFPPIPSIISRTHLIVDTHYTSPAHPAYGYPGPDGSILSPPSGPNGISSIPDELIHELPEDCRAAFEAEREKEGKWKRYWGNEGRDGSRPVEGLRGGVNGYPV